MINELTVIGCSKCHHVFSRTAENKTDYSGYDTNTWKDRSGAEHKQKGRETLNAKTKSELNALESEEGVRFSELFRLPYYDPIRMHVVDPMHNLFLGMAKHTLSTWVESGSLTDENLQVRRGDSLTF